MRDRIRYCAIEIGIGGFVPHAADEVEGLRYGDCKDKANLLKSLLQVAGIESRLVTIYADRSPRRFRLPVVAANFNHAILVVDLPEGPAFVDPTTRTVPFGDLPPWDEERECLPISATGSDIVMTPSSSPDTDQRDLRCTLAATPEGRATGTCHLELLGSFADGAREQFLSSPPEEHRTVVDAALQLRRATVKEHTGDGLAPPLFPTPARLDATIELELATSATTHPEFLTAAMLVHSDLLPSLPASRPAHDVVFHVRRRRTDTMIIKLPSTHQVRQLPPDTTIDGPFASFQVAWRTEGGHWLVPLEILRVAREEWFAKKERRLPIVVLEDMGVTEVLRLTPPPGFTIDPSSVARGDDSAAGYTSSVTVESDGVAAVITRSDRLKAGRHAPTYWTALHEASATFRAVRASLVHAVPSSSAAPSSAAPSSASPSSASPSSASPSSASPSSASPSSASP